MCVLAATLEIEGLKAQLNLTDRFMIFLSPLPCFVWTDLSLVVWTDLSLSERHNVVGEGVRGIGHGVGAG
jgi:hypothetical protein